MSPTSSIASKHKIIYGSSTWHLNYLDYTILVSSSRDVHLILISHFLRMFACDSATLMFAFYLADLGFSDSWIGLFFTSTLIGDALISLLLTLGVGLLGRRKVGMLGNVLMIVAGLLFTLTDNYWLLLLIAILGVISPRGNEIGPFRAIDEATLAQLSSLTPRSTIFAWFTIGGMLGTAVWVSAMRIVCAAPLAPLRPGHHGDLQGRVLGICWHWCDQIGYRLLSKP